MITASDRMGRIFQQHPRIWVAIALWIASNVFVTGVARIATWEGNASYRGMASLCQWDCGWFSTVMESGYDKTPTRDVIGSTNWPFHPLFPLTAYPFWHWLKLPPPMSLVLASKLALLLAVYAFLLMMSDQVDSTADLFRAGSLVAFNPYVIYAHAGYSEPLYSCLLALAFYLARQRRWIASGTMGALASGTRVLGFVFPISYMIVWLEGQNWRIDWRRLDLNRIIGLLLCPLGTAIYMLYLYHHTGDALAQVHGHAAWGKSPGNPFHVIWFTLTMHHWPRVWGIMTILGLLASAYLFKLRKADLGVFLAICVLLTISGGYTAIARNIWWQPPFLYAIYCALKRRTGAWLIYTAFVSGMASFMILEWFTGHNFVV